MRSSFTVATGLKLVRTPNYRHQAMRRRWMAGGFVAALVIVGGLVGFSRAPMGAFDLFPTHQESAP